MKIQKIIIVLLLWCGLFNAHAYANSPVWKISKDGNHLFLGGTIHLLSKSDYPLPGAFETAYNGSKILALETDLQKFGAPGFQQTILQNTMYSGDQDITHFLKPDTLLALQKYLAERGILLENIAKFKPGMLSVSLTMIELQRLGLVGTGVDEFFSLRALNDSKEIKHLETVYEQLEFLSKMGEGNENDVIQYTLDDMKNLPSFFGSIKNAWRDGDNAQLQKVALDPWIERFPQLYNSILVERNNNWVPKIERMLDTEEIEFVLFGTLHLVGEKGVLAQLKARGYTVENQ